MYQFAIVEDEDKSANRMQEYISRYCESTGEKAQIACFKDAAAFLHQYNPIYDVIFMDIAMPGMNGMEAAHRLRQYDKTAVLVFVTTLAQYAAKGYEVDALDFIVKPFSFQDFSMRLRRALERAASNAHTDIQIHIPNGFYVTDSNRLMYVEVISHDLVLHMTDDTLTTRGSLTELEKQLAPLGFIRCNACYLVNARHISRVQGLTVTVGKNELKISKTKKQRFLEELTRWYGEH